MSEMQTNGKKVRSVESYLSILATAGKSKITVRNYRQILKQYADYLKVPLDELHKHLDPDNLIRYANKIIDRSKAGRKSTLSVIARYMKVNGIEFDELEQGAFTVKADEDRTDKPLDVATIQKMMDQGNPHSRAIISFLVSTGCRAGETSQLLLSDIGTIHNGSFVPDINGDVVHIRNEIAKQRRGGYAFLTSEALEFLTIWLQDRERYMADADERTSKLWVTSTGHARVPRKDIGKPAKRPDNDQRLFACSYATIDKTFGRLYRAVDGSRGKYHAKITAHSCRAYFRTNAVKGMSIDLVEGILRHSGYLNDQYVRMPLEEQYRQFHAGETALYITRADHRIQGSKLDQLQREKDALQARVQQLEQKQQTIETLDKIPLSEADKDDIAKRMFALQKDGKK